MVDVTECENCGALLTEEDVFCGECGAPRPEPPEVEALEVAPEPVASPLSAPAEVGGARARRAGTNSATQGWRLGFMLLLVFGVLACVLSIVAFILFGVTEAEDFTPAENWLYAAFCCLLPLGAIGVAFLAAGAAIWFTRLRTR